MNHSYVSKTTRHSRTQVICFFAMLTFLALGSSAFGQSGDKPGDTIFMVVEHQPEFPGGEQARKTFFSKNLKTPKSATEAKGRVVISFVVNADGTLQDQKVLRSLSDEYDQEALRVVKLMPKWVPGRQSGRALRVRYVLPVEFL